MNAINKNEVSMFKVGDKVVFKDSDTYKNPLLKIVHIPLQKVVIVSTGINGYADFSHLRHATPEEIAAGHRIGNDMGDDMGDDSHIENHVSPLCKVGVK